MRNNLRLEIDLNNKEKNEINSENMFYKDDINIILLGNLYDYKSEKMKLEDIYNLYLKFGERIYNHLDGTYTLIIIDHIKNKLFTFQDYFRK